MPKRASTIPLAAIKLDQNAAIPLYRQLYTQLRQAILSGQLKPNTRLPSTRLLAQELGIARNTVLNAFEQLLAEGYIEGQTGAGTYVAGALPEELLQAQNAGPRHNPPGAIRRKLSRQGTMLAAMATEPFRDATRTPAFKLGMPALDELPFKSWEQLWLKRWGTAPRELLTYGEAAGYRPLRKAIATYLGASRAVRCEADQVIIVAGTQGGMDLAARILLDPGDVALMEDPGYLGAHGALRAAGATIAPVPVDQDGLDIRAGSALYPTARLAYVSPSHQYPLGVTMSLRRRLELLEWASSTGAWIIEDDYDSEYRYAGRPLAALQGLDNAGRVIYIGTFSKVLFPALRLAYLVVPPDLVEPFVKARMYVDRASPLLEQAVLADFIEEGHFARHIRRMRQLYEARQGVLLAAAAQSAAGLLDIKPSEAGMHAVAWLPNGTNDVAVAAAAYRAGLDVEALSGYCSRVKLAPGLVLGYAGLNDREIQDGVLRLAWVVAEVSGRTRRQ